jgi:Tol biopolymer transport system component
VTLLREFVNDLPGDIYDAALSPAGDRLALTWCRHMGPQYQPEYQCGVYLRPSGGGEPKLLFNYDDLALELRWSPDGKWLAYTDHSSRSGSDLFVRPIGGGEARRIAAICGSYSWTADSRGFIVSASQEPSSGNCSLKSYSRDGKQISLIAKEGYQPAVSPDGGMVAFALKNQIMLQAITTSYQAQGPARSVATEKTFFYGPVWIGGGKELLYATRDREPLHRVAITTGARPQTVSGIDNQTEFSSLEATSAGQVTAEVYRHDAELWRMDLRAQNPRFEKLQAIPHTDSRHRVSPDGRRVVFVSRGALWTSDLNGSNARLVTSHSELILNPRFSPDGRSIAFSGNPAKFNTDLRSRFYIVPADGGTPRRLVPRLDNFRSATGPATASGCTYHVRT